MATSALRGLIPSVRRSLERQPSIVIGITSAQTCLVLAARLRALRAAGFQVSVISSPGDLFTNVASTEGISHFPLPIARQIAPFADLISFFRLYRLLGRLQPDIVEFSTPKAGLLGTVAAMLRRVPHRVYMLRGLKLETATGLKRWLLLIAERLAAASAHAVLCNSESLRARALSLHIAPAAKLLVLGSGSSNGVNTKKFAPGLSNIRRQLGIPTQAPVIGFVGRLTRDKGVPELFKAFLTLSKIEPALRLLLVGWFDQAEDAINAELRARIVSHPHVYCTGFVPDTAPYYRAMDLMVLPTWREGFPNVVLEAAATGIPVITTESTGSRDSVVPEVTGLLIPPGHPEAICESVLKLLRDPARRAKMGRDARAWVCEHFAEDGVLGLIADYYVTLFNDAQRFRPSESKNRETESIAASS